MPYIKPERRKIVDKWIDIYLKEDRGGKDTILPSDIAYLVYKLFMYYIDDKDINWWILMEGIMGIQSALDEIKRRHLYAYEDEKIKENGDIKIDG